MKIVLTGNVFPFGIGHAYGGERILGYLTEELVLLGHEVYLFAREGTNVPAATEYIPVGPLTNETDVHYDAVKAYIKVIGLNPDIYFCGYFGEGWNPEVAERFPYVELVWNVWCHMKWQMNLVPFNVVTYSKILQDDFLRQNVGTTMIHYGLPENLYEYQPHKEDYACWLGKIEGGKAPRIAIALAKAAGVKLVIMGPPYNSGTFWNEVAPHIDNENIFWVRGVDDAMKYEIMSKAKFLLYTNDNSWKEHFGIIMAEALAMGTPVVGMNRIDQDCSIVTDKIIEHGKHGFILNYKDSNDIDAIIETGVPLINRVHTINPRDCRDQFEKRFTASLMAKRYEWFFNQIKDGSKFESLEVPF